MSVSRFFFLFSFLYFFFFFKQKTAYEMRISDWSSDVCSSDLVAAQHAGALLGRTLCPRDHRARSSVNRLLDLFAAAARHAADALTGRRVVDVDPFVSGQDRKSTRLNSSH